MGLEVEEALFFFLFESLKGKGCIESYIMDVNG